MTDQLYLFPANPSEPAQAVRVRPLRSDPNAHEVSVTCLREIGPRAHGDKPELIRDYWHNAIPSAPWWDPMKEHAVAVLVNVRRRIIGHALIAIGSLDTITIHPREVFRPAIIAAASAIVLTHNHPSGDPSPSGADITVTRNLCRAAQHLQIDILDHVIIGCVTYDRPKDFFSLRENGYFESLG